MLKIIKKYKPSSVLIVLTSMDFYLSPKERSDLLEILPKSQATWLENVEDLKYFKSPEQLDEVLRVWKTKGVRIETVGESLGGLPIKAAIFEPRDIYRDDYREENTPTVLAWGYPHPDEPLGAEALVVLGNALLEDSYNDLELGHLRFVFILCGDIDNASEQMWHGDKIKKRLGQSRLPNISEYFFGVWRPTHLGIEIDYGFPIDWGPFYQPEDFPGACHNFRQCSQGCKSFRDCCYKEEPYGPLPESIALTVVMERYRPKIVFSMHSNHTGGDYTFLFLRESKETLENLTRIPEIFNYRHLGEPLDRGHRWQKKTPDLLKERDLNYLRKQIEARPGYEEGAQYYGNASAVNWIEANLPGTQFICPEATLFGSKDFQNENIIEQKIKAKILTTKTTKGEIVDKYYYGDLYFMLVRRDDIDFIDNESAELDHEPLQHAGSNFREEEIIIPRALLGVQALEHRRRVLDKIDKLWDQLHVDIDFAKYPDLTHIFRDERDSIKVPGKFVSDQSMRIFRTREDYRRPVTIAQAATFRFFWSAQTAFVVGNFNNYLQYILENHERFKIAPRDLYLIEQAQQKLITLQENELIDLPNELKTIKTGQALRSVLGRVLVLINSTNFD